jgi:hypothetical protein
VPTLLDLLGFCASVVAGPAAGSGSAAAGSDKAGTGPPGSSGPAFEGRSLRPAVEGRPLPPGWQHAAQGSLRSISDGCLKLVHDLASGGFTLYDLAADPRESRDVVDQRRSDYRRLREALNGWLARTEGRQPGEGLRRAKEAERSMRALGYLD